MQEKLQMSAAGIPSQLQTQLSCKNASHKQSVTFTAVGLNQTTFEFCGTFKYEYYIGFSVCGVFSPETNLSITAVEVFPVQL